MNQAIFYFQKCFPLGLICIYPTRATRSFDPIVLDFIAKVVFRTYGYLSLPVLAALIATINMYHSQFIQMLCPIL